jgi:transcriptional regulator with XRE-family HTH domain
MSRYGVQPAREALARHGLSIAVAADTLGESRTHLNNTLLGRTPPCGRLRESLPALLDIPLEQLFTPEILNAKSRRHVTYVPVARRSPREIERDLERELARIRS